MGFPSSDLEVETQDEDEVLPSDLKLQLSHQENMDFVLVFFIFFSDLCSLLSRKFNLLPRRFTGSNLDDILQEGLS